MKDSFGRVIDYARISITDRCNLRCRYCMPESGIRRLDRGNILTFEEIGRLAGILGSLGIKTIRITGGEPLERTDAVSCAALVAKTSGIERVSLTTNGIRLAQYAENLKKAGVSGINISLDTADAFAFAEYTGGGELDDVLRGLRKALDAGFESVKINTVLLRSLHGKAPIAGQEPTDPLCGPALFAKDNPVQVRFIELMPVGRATEFETIGALEAKERLTACFGPLKPVSGVRGNGPASYYRAEGFTGSFGFIPALAGGFCDSCNRIRITAEGFLKPCLYFSDGIDLREPLRNGETDADIGVRITETVLRKPERHRFGAREEGSGRECLNMFSIGG